MGSAIFMPVIFDAIPQMNFFSESSQRIASNGASQSISPVNAPECLNGDYFRDKIKGQSREKPRPTLPINSIELIDIQYKSPAGH